MCVYNYISVVEGAIVTKVVYKIRLFSIKMYFKSATNCNLIGSVIIDCKLRCGNQMPEVICSSRQLSICIKVRK